MGSAMLTYGSWSGCSPGRRRTEEWRWRGCGGVAMVLVALVLLLLVAATEIILMRRRRWRSGGRGRIGKRNGGEATAVTEAQHLDLPPSPAGSVGVPWFGHLLHLLLFSRSGELMAPHRWFDRLSRSPRNGQVAPLLFLWLGRVPTLLVSTAAAACLVLHDHDLDFGARPSTSAARLLLYGPADLAFTPYGPYWRKVKELYMTKLFNVTQLRHFMPIRAQELSRLISSISADAAAPQVLRTKLFDMAFDNISRMALGASARDFTAMFYGSSLDFMKVVRDAFELLGAFNIGDFLPTLRWLDLQGYERRIKQTHTRLDAMLQRIIDDRREACKSSSNDGSPTIVDVMLFQFDESLGLNTNSKSKDDCIKAMILDLFLGGTDSIISTIEWALSELLKNKEIMTELRRELDNVIGMEEIVQESHLPHLPFLQAVVKETLRVHPPGAILIGHEAGRPCEVAGYYVPHKTRALINAWAIARDESVWEKPSEFLPHRFMDSTIDVKGHHYQLLPFGAGRRACPAMNLGLLSTQLALAALVHCFEWSLPNGLEEIDMNERYALSVHKATPLIVMATRRLPQECYTFQ